MAVEVMAGMGLGSGGVELPILLLGLFGGLLALDDTALAQTWFSQPLPAAILTGAFCGDALTGLAIGLPVQMALAGNLPVGQSFVGDHVTAVVAVVGAVVLSAQELTPALGGGEMASVSFVGWMIVAVGLVSTIGHFAVHWERQAHSVWMLEGHQTLRDGNLERIDRLHARCLFATFLRGFVTTALLVPLLVSWWIPLYAHLPAVFLRVLGMVTVLLPGIGIGSLIDRYGVRRSWLWLVGGLAVASVMTRIVA